MSRQRVVVFDLETVPDLAVGRELIQAAPDAADEQVRRTLGERYARTGEDPNLAFVKAPLQKIVCVGAIYAEREDRGPWTVTRSGVVDVAQRPERELVQSFIESLSETPSPQLVGLNSSGLTSRF